MDFNFWTFFLLAACGRKHRHIRLVQSQEFAHPTGGAGGIKFLTCPSLCVYLHVYMHAWAEASSDQLVVNCWLYLNWMMIAVLLKTKR